MHPLPHCIPLLLYAQGHTAPAAPCKGKVHAVPPPPPPPLPSPPSTPQMQMPLSCAFCAASALAPTRPNPTPPAPAPSSLPHRHTHSPLPPVCAISASSSLELGLIHPLLSSSPVTDHVRIVFSGFDASYALLTVQAQGVLSRALAGAFITKQAGCYCFIMCLYGFGKEVSQTFFLDVGPAFLDTLLALHRQRRCSCVLRLKRRQQHRSRKPVLPMPQQDNDTGGLVGRVQCTGGGGGGVPQLISPSLAGGVAGTITSIL